MLWTTSSALVAIMTPAHDTTSPPEPRRVRARVIGRVQGVFYRASTAREAARRGLTGWVRNCADGSVELEVQGARAAVEALLGFCRRGPPAALVERLEVEEQPPVDDERDFRVRR